MVFLWYYCILPMLIAVGAIGLMFLSQAFRKKSSKWDAKMTLFEAWLKEVWPNRIQKEAVVLIAIIGFFIWGLTR